ncbi:MAG: TrkA C-terminal domain-containing protein [Pseudomonadota bacterium]
MIPLITLMFVITLSILITRIATIALTYTGLSRESARFQARSAFTGVGFTTSEAESVVNHPVRRRILMLLMLFGNAGIVTVMASVVLTFMDIESSGVGWWRLLLLAGGLLVLWWFSVSKWIDLRLSKLINWALRKYTSLDVRDYASLLHMAGEYRVSELYVEENDWLAESTLEELRLQDEGIMILGITRKKGAYLGAPDGHTKILPGDVLILYGQNPAFESLDQRRRGKRGDKEHEKAVAEFKERVEEERQEDIKIEQEEEEEEEKHA